MTITYEEKDLIYDLLTGENFENILVVEESGKVISDSKRELIGNNILDKPYIKAIINEQQNHFSYCITSYNVCYTKLLRMPVRVITLLRGI